MSELKFKNRPISPHVSIFHLGWSGTLSILHRVTGIILSIYLLLIVLYFKFFTYHLSTYWIYELGYTINGMKGLLLSSSSLLLCLFFAYHFATGIRHLIWDTGFGFDPKEMKKSSILIIILSIVVGFSLWLSL